MGNPAPQCADEVLIQRFKEAWDTNDAVAEHIRGNVVSRPSFEDLLQQVSANSHYILRKYYDQLLRQRNIELPGSYEDIDPDVYSDMCSQVSDDDPDEEVAAQNTLSRLADDWYDMHGAMQDDMAEDEHYTGQGETWDQDWPVSDADADNDITMHADSNTAHPEDAPYSSSIIDGRRIIRTAHPSIDITRDGIQISGPDILNAMDHENRQHGVGNMRYQFQ